MLINLVEGKNQSIFVLKIAKHFSRAKIENLDSGKRGRGYVHDELNQNVMYHVD